MAEAARKERYSSSSWSRSGRSTAGRRSESAGPTDPAIELEDQRAYEPGGRGRPQCGQSGRESAGGSDCSSSSCDARSHVVSELPIGGSTDVMLSE